MVEVRNWVARRERERVRVMIILLAEGLGDWLLGSCESMEEESRKMKFECSNAGV